MCSRGTAQSTDTRAVSAADLPTPGCGAGLSVRFISRRVHAQPAAAHTSSMTYLGKDNQIESISVPFVRSVVIHSFVILCNSAERQSCKLVTLVYFLIILLVDLLIPGNVLYNKKCLLN